MGQRKWLAIDNYQVTESIFDGWISQAGKYLKHNLFQYNHVIDQKIQLKLTCRAGTKPTASPGAPVCSLPTSQRQQSWAKKHSRQWDICDGKGNSSLPCPLNLKASLLVTASLMTHHFLGKIKAFLTTKHKSTACILWAIGYDWVMTGQTVLGAPGSTWKWHLGPSPKRALS